MTILGQWTVSELDDLVKAKDYEIKQLQVARDKFVGPMSDASWDSDFAALQSRYAPARAQAEKVIALNPLMPSLTAAQAEYDAVLNAVKINPSTITKGDLQDLHNRLAAIGVTPTYPNMPQPKPGNDFDLSYYNNPAVVAVSKAVDKTKDAIPGVGKPLTLGQKVGLAVGGAVLLGITLKIAK